MPTRQRGSPTPAQRAQWADERHAKLAELHQRIVEKVDALTDGDQWRAWLSFSAKFYSYSFSNTVAIWMQRPDATWVAGYQRWKELGRYVRSGEKGIAILAPLTRRVAPAAASGSQPAPAGAAGSEAAGPVGVVVNVTGARAATLVEALAATVDDERPHGRVLSGFRIVTVFDISQTDGPPITVPSRPTTATVDVSLLAGQAPPGVYEALIGVADQHGYRVERGDCNGANGVTHYDEHLIRIRDDVDDAQAVKTLIHEIAHAVMHAPDPDAGWLEVLSSFACQGQHEVEAESVAYLVAANVGLDTSSYTFGYVTGWAEHAARTTNTAPHDVVRASGQRIIATAATISAGIDTGLGATTESPSADLAQRVSAGVQRSAQLRADAHAALAAPAYPPAPPPASRAFPPPRQPTQPAPRSQPPAQTATAAPSQRRRR